MHSLERLCGEETMTKIKSSHLRVLLSRRWKVAHCPRQQPHVPPGGITLQEYTRFQTLFGDME